MKIQIYIFSLLIFGLASAKGSMTSGTPTFIQESSFVYQGQMQTRQVRIYESGTKATASGLQRYYELRDSGYDCALKPQSQYLCKRITLLPIDQITLGRIEAAYQGHAIEFSAGQGEVQQIETNDVYTMWRIPQKVVAGGIEFLDYRIYQGPTLEAVWLNRGSLSRSLVKVSEDRLGETKEFSLSKGNINIVYVVELYFDRAILP